MRIAVIDHQRVDISVALYIDSGRVVVDFIGNTGSGVVGLTSARIYTSVYLPTYGSITAAED